MSQAQKKKRHVLPTLVLAFAGLSVSTAHAHDSTATNSNNVRAVLTTMQWSDSGTHSIEVNGLKDVQACFQLAKTVTSNASPYIRSSVSCLQDGEVIGIQTCDGKDACKPTIFKTQRQTAQ